MTGISFTKNSVPTYHDERLTGACKKYGDLFQDFTLMEKFNILTAIGMWGEYWDTVRQMSLADYLNEFEVIRVDTDAFDMLAIDLGELYRTPQEAMGLISAVASQISEGIWLKQ